jgi:hypothetical protein
MQIQVIANSWTDRWAAVLAARQSDVDNETLVLAIRLAHLSRKVGSLGIASGPKFKVRVLTGSHNITADDGVDLALAYARRQMKPCALTLVASHHPNESPWKRQGFKVRWQDLATHPLRDVMEELHGASATTES